MQFIINKQSRQGTMHKSRNIHNQDAVFAFTDNNTCSIVLTDGAGSRKMSEYGAAHIAHTVCHYLTNNFSRLYSISSNEIRAEIMKFIHTELDILSEKYQSPKSQFASTLIFAATDGKIYIAGHLGDGCIICMYENDWNVMSFPQNGKNTKSTYLTTTFSSENHLRIQRGECRNITGFLLASDGILPYVFGSSFAYPGYISLIQAFDEAAGLKTKDDASYISVCIRKE